MRYYTWDNIRVVRWIYVVDMLLDLESKINIPQRFIIIAKE